MEQWSTLVGTGSENGEGWQNLTWVRISFEWVEMNSGKLAVPNTQAWTWEARHGVGGARAGRWLWPAVAAAVEVRS